MSQSARSNGFGRVLVVVYGVLAIAATGRSLVQIVRDFDAAPLAYSLSAAAALVYILATVALLKRGAGWRRVAVATIGFELVGVLAVGVLSLTAPELFGHPSVWSWFGMGYGFIPLILPIVGLWWVLRGSERNNNAH
ncbi:MAG: hypothetical protein ACTJGQ_01290 [Agrococcus casei]|uniref:Putative integral membrane protein n=1 Tax=Agrococcus casei LMG 22410 TaxID=1255656 RepID=A0A1R4FWJ2_9MICO|nr:hypothetical protein [Agrococcus casei]SJM60092.1 putative integral membrane protein [Agrococcus casei LMG 22410]